MTQKIRMSVKPIDRECPRGYIYVPSYIRRDGVRVPSFCREDPNEEKRSVEQTFQQHLKKYGMPTDVEGTPLMKKVENARENHPVRIENKEQLTELLDGSIGWKKMTIYRNGKYHSDEYSSSSPFQFVDLKKSKVLAYTKPDSSHIFINVEG